MDPIESPPTLQVGPEWIRAGGFVVAAIGLGLMALVDPHENTTWWIGGLSTALVGVTGLLIAAMRIPSARELFRALFRLRFADAVRASRELNRVPEVESPNRTARLTALVFGPLGAVAGLVALVRLIAS